MAQSIYHNGNGDVHLEMLIVCCLIWPWSHVKLEKIQQVIEHYSHLKMNGKVVNLEEYKQLMSLE